MKTYIQLLISFVLLSIASSCKKNEDPAPAPQSPTQALTLRMTPMVGNDTLKFNTSFTSEDNVRYTLSSFRYYMSDISLIKSDGSEYALTDKVILVNATTSDYTLGNVPVGDYKGIRFSVGLNKVTNHLDPTTYPSSHPLAIQSPGIHWNWNTGYIFLSMEGTCDITAANDDVLTYGQYSHDLLCHIGTDALLRTVDADNKAFTVSSNSPKVLSIHSDINKLFIGVDMKTENQTHSMMSSMPLATKVADNIADMFVIQE